VDDLAGRFFVRIKRTGVQRYFELPISGNGASTLIVDTLGIVGDLLATDTVEIVYPGARIDGVTDGTFFLGGDNGLRAAATPLFSNDPNYYGTFERVSLAGQQLSRAGSLTRVWDRCSFVSNVSPALTPLVGIHAGGVGFVNCAIRSGTVSLNATDANSAFLPRSRKDSASVPSVVAPSVSLTGYASRIIMGGVLAPGTTLAMTGPSGFNVDLPLSLWAANAVSGYGALTVMALSTFIVRGAGVLIGSSAVAGSVGVKAKVGSQIRVDPTVCGLSGPAGADLNLETGAPVSYGTAAGQFMEVAGINGNLYRGNLATGDPSRIFTTI
jgi:hypothetical protein